MQACNNLTTCSGLTLQLWITAAYKDPNYLLQADQNLTTVYRLATGHKPLNSEQDFCDRFNFPKDGALLDIRLLLDLSWDDLRKAICSLRGLVEWDEGGLGELLNYGSHPFLCSGTSFWVNILGTCLWLSACYEVPSC